MMKSLFVSTVKTAGISQETNVNSMKEVREMTGEKKCSLLVKYDWNPVWQEK